jgi:hypothetical protein
MFGGIMAAQQRIHPILAEAKQTELRTHLLLVRAESVSKRATRLADTPQFKRIIGLIDLTDFESALSDIV